MLATGTMRKGDVIIRMVGFEGGQKLRIGHEAGSLIAPTFQHHRLYNLHASH